MIIEYNEREHIYVGFMHNVGGLFIGRTRLEVLSQMLLLA